jgi:hypothetical protein
LSSILDALKRIEKEEGPPSGPMHAPSWLDKPEVDPDLSHRVAGFFLRRRRFFWICCLVSIAAVTAALLAAGGFFTAGEKEAVLESGPPAAGALPEKSAATVDRTKEAARRQATAPAAAKSERINQGGSARFSARPVSNGAPAAPKAGVRPPAARPAAGGGIASESSAARQDGSAASRFMPLKAVERRTAPLTPAAAPAAGIADAAPEDEPVQNPTTADSGAEKEASTALADPRPGPIMGEVQTLPTESGLQLQAISWSDVPEKRIAVVNGRILKEGDRIEKYVLSEIHEDDVVFRHSGQRWKLGFQPR